VSTNEDNWAQEGLPRSQGTLDDGAEQSGVALPQRERVVASAPHSRTNPRVFLDEVMLELRKVMRPKRAELVNYSTVVFFTLAFVMALVYGLDYVYSLGASHLFK
jgi:preprotein translocase subunit SecE